MICTRSPSVLVVLFHHLPRAATGDEPDDDAHAAMRELLEATTELFAREYRERLLALQPTIKRIALRGGDGFGGVLAPGAPGAFGVGDEAVPEDFLAAVSEFRDSAHDRAAPTRRRPTTRPTPTTTPTTTTGRAGPAGRGRRRGAEREPAARLVDAPPRPTSGSRYRGRRPCRPTTRARPPGSSTASRR